MNFDPIAQYYLSTRHKVPGKLLELAQGVLADLSEYLPSEGSIEVFEPGCGTGYFLKAFLNASERVHAHGWDISKEMLRYAVSSDNPDPAKRPPLEDIPAHRHQLEPLDILDDNIALPRAHIAMSHLVLHLLKDWKKALGRILNNDNLVSYVHFFEDNDYFSAVAGSPLRLHPDLPMAKLQRIYKEELAPSGEEAENKGVIKTPGVYLPYEVVKYINDTHDHFSLISVRKVTWTHKYEYKDFIDDLEHQVMSTFHFDSNGRRITTRQIQNAVERVRDELRQYEGKHSIELPHDLWAFVFAKTPGATKHFPAVTLPPSKERPRTTVYKHSSEKNKIENIQAFYAWLESILESALSDHRHNVFLCSVSVFYKEADIRKRFVLWWTALTRSEVINFYEQSLSEIENREKVLRDSAPDPVDEAARSGSPTYVTANEPPTPDLFELRKSASDSNYQLYRINESGEQFVTSFDVGITIFLAQVFDILKVLEPATQEDDIEFLLANFGGTAKARPSVIFIVGRRDETLQALENCIRYFSEALSIPVYTSASLPLPLRVFVSSDTGRSVDEINQDEFSDAYRKVFPDNKGLHEIENIITASEETLREHLTSEDVSSTWNTISEYKYYLDLEQEIDWLTKNEAWQCSEFALRMCLCKLEIKRGELASNSLSWIVLAYRLFKSLDGLPHIQFDSEKVVEELIHNLCDKDKAETTAAKIKRLRTDSNIQFSTKVAKAITSHFNYVHRDGIDNMRIALVDVNNQAITSLARITQLHEDRESGAHLWLRFTIPQSEFVAGYLAGHGDSLGSSSEVVFDAINSADSPMVIFFGKGRETPNNLRGLLSIKELKNSIVCVGDRTGSKFWYQVF